MSVFSNNKKLIMDYINGNDIKVDENILEEDLDFMIAAIDFSDDEKLYNLCDDKIKYNFKLIKFLIAKFSDNMDFILNLVIDFLDNYDHTYWYKKYMEETFDENPINTEELEVLITIDKYLPVSLDARVLDIKVRLETTFIKFRTILESILASSNDSKLEALVGKGFSLITSMFPTSYLVKDFYAKEMIREITLSYQGNTLDEKIHNIYNKDNVPSTGIKVLFDIVKRHDLDLAEYILVRPQSFESIINEIIKILKNWDNQETIYLDNKINHVLEVIEDYYFKYGHFISKDEFETVKYYASLLGLEEDFRRLDPTSYECESIPIVKENNYYDKKMFKELTPIIKGIMAGKDEYDFLSVGEGREDTTGNVTQFRPRH